MKVSIAALKKMLTEQIATAKAEHDNNVVQVTARRTKELRELVTRTRKFLSTLEVQIRAGDVLGEIHGPNLHLYSERERNDEVVQAKKALKLLQLTTESDITVAEASKIVGKALTDFA